MSKNDEELDAAMARMEELALANPEPTGEIANEMELLSLVISDYENKHYSEHIIHNHFIPQTQLGPRRGRRL